MTLWLAAFVANGAVLTLAVTRVSWLAVCYLAEKDPMIADDGGCYYDDDVQPPAPPTRWERVESRVRSWFRGPVGYTGPMGMMGETGMPGRDGKDGHLQLSGFPTGTLICLYDADGALMWSGALRQRQLPSDVQSIM